MGDRFPNHAFTLVVWEDNLKTLEGKQLAITGLIEEYRGKPQIIVNNPEQIVVMK
jgi:DNA/RNA endonuclease YhcR with UshA esterase domain